ncbi:MAG: hypothetical protein VXW92_06325 [Actinomycetota bacterium]|nr:hypothetical protein [Micrococcales bacterium]MEC7000799.1 hypothetical protein [Actinomycetota bacterium]MEC7104076.1 hypothetical protein [Actinomycetota bacterium]MEC7591369.1 hypothetical protein [Actinomycetota bacterium]MEC8648465.1 hypothetical protein [Actinomycetota bacterium]
MGVVFFLIGAAVVAAIAWFVVGKFEVWLPDAGSDLKPDTRDDHPAFDVVLRGYRMDEVDSTIAQLQAEIESLRTNDHQR